MIGKVTSGSDTNHSDSTTLANEQYNWGTTVADNVDSSYEDTKKSGGCGGMRRTVSLVPGS